MGRQNLTSALALINRTVPFIFVVGICLFYPFSASCANETFLDSVTNSQNYAANPSGWVPQNNSIITVPGDHSTDTQYGLKYSASGKLVVRTTASYYTGSWLDNLYIRPDYVFREGADPKKVAAWVTTGNDLTNFFDTNKDSSSSSGTNAIKLIERGLGMNDTGTHNTVVEYAVTPTNNYIMRATKNPDIRIFSKDYTKYGDPASFQQPGDMTTAWANFYGTDGTDGYYAYWKTQAYPAVPPPTLSNFPWSQLGYTYFWGNAPSTPTELSQVQGMSEFIILANTSLEVYGIYATQSYVYTKNKDGAFSSDSDAQYGNGFASFDVTGPCDSIWAGHRFQANTRTSSLDPNEIIIESGATISGGEGILVWSLNYNVTNNGTISGATASKIATSSTENIAILFEGDTTAYGGVAAPTGINSLTNNGVISSPGTAIKILSGNTTIVNNSGGTISGTTAAINSSGTGAMSITNRGTITGDILLKDATIATTLDIGNTDLTLTNGHLSSLTLTANSATDYGTISTTDMLIDASSTLSVTIGGYIPNNTDLRAIYTNAGIFAVPGLPSSSSPVFTFSRNISGNDLVLTATRAKSYNSFASGSNAANAGSVLNTLAMNNTATGDMVNILGALDSLTSAAAINQALENMLPNVDDSSPQVTQATLDQYLSTVFAHLDAFKNVTSEASIGPDMWASGFGSYIHQDPRGASNGYNATIWGTALGCDVLAINNLRLGMSGGFAQGFVRSKDSSGRTDINSYQGSLYGSYAKDAYYIDAAVSFAYNTYDASRHVTVGALDRTASGDYSGQQYSGYIGGGYKFKGKNIELTPLVSFQYMHIRLNSYTEDGAGAANLKIDPQDYDVAQTGLGMKLGYPVELKGGAGRLTPELKFKWLYDWVGDAQQSASTFTGGGGSFGTTGFTPAQSSYDFGTKLILETKKFVTVSLSYDLEIKEDFYGHYGSAEVRYRF